MKQGFYLALLALTFSSALSSQNKGKAQPFTTKLQGSISGFTGQKLYLHHKWEDAFSTDSAMVKDGKFVFTIKSTDPNMYWITFGLDPNMQPNVSFFADKAPLKATLKADSLGYSVIEGGQAQKDFTEYRNMINGFVAVQMRMQNDYNAAVQKGDMQTQEAIRAEYGNLNTQYLAGLKNFVKTHPTSAVSGYVIYTDLGNPAIPLAEVEEALGYLDKSITDTKFAKLAAKRVNDVKGTTVGHTATDFKQSTPDGKTVKLSDFRGKYVLLDFWASWCRPCRMENPNVVAAFNRYKDKGFTVLGVSLDNNKEPWLAAIQQDKLTWTHVSDLKGWGNEAGRLYGVTGIPQNFLIDKDGKIIAKDLRGAALDEKLAEVLEKGDKGIR